jgi:hypothetical protein
LRGFVVGRILDDGYGVIEWMVQPLVNFDCLTFVGLN